MISYSVVIPIFNRGDNLSPLLDDLENQSWAPSEVIVVDDQSDQEHRRVMMCAVANQRIPVRLIRTPRRMYASGARLLGAVEVASEWIVFVDSDNRLQEDCCKVLVSKLRMGDVALVGAQSHYRSSGEVWFQSVSMSQWTSRCRYSIFEHECPPGLTSPFIKTHHAPNVFGVRRDLYLATAHDSLLFGIYLDEASTAECLRRATGMHCVTASGAHAYHQVDVPPDATFNWNALNADERMQMALRNRRLFLKMYGSLVQRVLYAAVVRHVVLGAYIVTNYRYLSTSRLRRMMRGTYEPLPKSIPVGDALDKLHQAARG